MLTLATIGYERTTPASLITTLHETGVELLVDVRAVASSRRPGFAKTALTASLRSGGIDYLHLRGLGTPADGRAAARAGRHEDLRRSYTAHLRTLAARDDFEVLLDLVTAGHPACLLCLEAQPEHCHRRMVTDAVQRRIPVQIQDLFPVTA
ncbi:MAG: DUF488 domain-containing protein [Gemmatimonadota bacterium]